MIVVAIFVICGIVASILCAIEVGYKIGLRRWARIQTGVRGVNPTLEASIFGLMGLLIAFIFYGAGNRFDVRRTLTVQEANAIGTAYLRLDLLPPEAQPALREDFRAYLQSRLAVFHKIPDPEAMNAEVARSSALQDELWKKAVAATKESGPATQTLVMASLNEVIDITTAQSVALSTHPPPAVFAMLAVTMLAASALAGYSMSASGHRDWVLVMAYALVLGVAVYVIIDYEYPRMGLVRVDAVDKALTDTLARMK